MSDLVERWKRWLEHTGYDGGVDSPPMLVLYRMEADAARITELETALAEAEGRVVADVVKWLRDGGGKDAADLRRLHADKRLSPAMTKEWETLIQTKAGIATALETGEWKK